MGLEDAIGLAKDYAQKYLQMLTDFFRGPYGKTSKTYDDYSEIIAASTVYLVVGVTLQDEFISKIDASKISWLDRSVREFVFWITLTLIAQLALRLLAHRATGAFRPLFRVLPIAFLCGAYAGTIGTFIARMGAALGYDALLLPHLCHIAAQSLVLALYLPRYLAYYCKIGRFNVLAVTAIVLCALLTVDLGLLYGRAFVPAPPLKKQTGTSAKPVGVTPPPASRTPQGVKP